MALLWTMKTKNKMRIPKWQHDERRRSALKTVCTQDFTFLQKTLTRFLLIDDEELDEEDLELLEENTGVKVARSTGVSSTYNATAKGSTC